MLMIFLAIVTLVALWSLLRLIPQLAFIGLAIIGAGWAIQNVEFSTVAFGVVFLFWVRQVIKEGKRKHA